MRPLILMVLAAALPLAVGCDDSGEPAPGGAAFDGPSVADRYPSARLPFEMRADPVPTHLDPETGGLVNLNRAHLAVAATDPFLYVVFAPAGAPGFRVAWAGLDAPWQSADLIDWAYEETGDLAAVGLADGRLAVAIRRPDLYPETRLLIFDPNQGVVLDEAVPREPRPFAITTWYRGAGFFQDLAVGQSPSGAIDVIYRQAWANTLEDAGTDVRRCRYHPDTGRWDPEDVLLTARRSDVLDSERENVGNVSPDIGVRTWIEYAEHDQLWVASLRRLTGDGTQTAGNAWGWMVATSRAPGDAEWIRTRPAFQDPGVPHWNLPVFDLHVARDGVAYITPAYSEYLVTEGHYRKSGLEPVAGFIHSQRFMDSLQDENETTHFQGGHIIADACGELRVVGQPPPQRTNPLGELFPLWLRKSEVLSQAETAASLFCHGGARAPVGGDRAAFRGDAKANAAWAVFAQGRRPYDVAVCPGTKPWICHGARVFSSEDVDLARVPLTPPEVLPRVADTYPAPGAVVGTDLDEVRLTLDRDDWVINRICLHDLERPGGICQVRATGDPVLAIGDFELRPNSEFRVSAQVAHRDARWSGAEHHFIEVPFPAFTFRTEAP